MKKRFVDVDIWQKEWFQDLSLKEKILVKYIFENCDNAGVWTCNFKMAGFIIGETVTMEDINKINEKKNLFEVLPNGKIFVFDFVEFQYGTLSENCKPHKPIIELLKKHGLFERVLQNYSKGIDTLSEKNENSSKGIDTLEEKEKEIEKDKETDKEEETETEKKEEIKKENPVYMNPDLMFDKNIEKVFKEYENTCKNCLQIIHEKRNLDFRQEILDFLKTINFDFDYIGELCRKANSLKKIYDNPIDIKALIKNHERIFNGFYIRGQTENIVKANDLMKQDSILKFAVRKDKQ